MLRFICIFFINSYHFRFLLAKFKPSLLLMESRYRGQDVVRCTLCTTAVAPMHCEVCQIDLCKDCVEKHLSDQSKSQVHKVVSLKQYHFSWQYRNSQTTPANNVNSTARNVMFQFVLSVLFRRSINTTKLLTLRKFTKIIKNLQELQNSIYPQYQEFTALINDQRKAKQCSHSEDLKAALNKHGEILHKKQTP